MIPVNRSAPTLSQLYAPAAPQIVSEGPDAALVELGRALHRSGYRFVTPTPETHRRVNSRNGDQAARSVRDVFGWNRPFEKAVLRPDVLDLMESGGVLARCGGHFRSNVRFSSLANRLYVHSPFPTTQADAVFFGPDTYRFARLIEQVIRADRRPIRSVLDIGCGSGAGGLHAAQLLGTPQPRLTLVDINPQALRFAGINAALGALPEAELRHSDVVSGMEGQFDLIVSNPPYMVDPQMRSYRHGGGALGDDLSLRILAESMPRIAPGGRLVLYTGVAVVDGYDAFGEQARAILTAAGLRFDYAEIDPDVFGEELENDWYSAVDRLAAVALIVDTLAE